MTSSGKIINEEKLGELLSCMSLFNLEGSKDD
jgi:hypothetical protein